MPKDDTLFAVPEAIANHFELDRATYADGYLHVQNTVSVPVKEEFGPDAAALLQMVADADDNRKFEKAEVKALMVRMGLIAMKHYGVGNFLQ